MNRVQSGLTIGLIKQKMWDVGEYSAVVLLKYENYSALAGIK